MRKSYFIGGLIVIAVMTIMILFLPPYLPKSYLLNFYPATEFMIMFGVLATVYGWIEDEVIKQ